MGQYFSGFKCEREIFALRNIQAVISEKILIRKVLRPSHLLLSILFNEDLEYVVPQANTIKRGITYIRNVILMT